MTEPKTVLIFESGETGGGSFESLYQHMRTIDRTRFRPVVVCLNEVSYVGRIREMDIPVHVLTDRLYSRHVSRRKRWLFGKLRRAGIRTNHLSHWLYPRILGWVHAPTIRALVALAREERADLIHLNVQPYRDYFAIIAADRLGIPCVSHLRSPEPAAKTQFNPSMARFANKVVDAYIANSSTTREIWLEVGLAPAKMHTILNGIETGEVQAMDVRERWGIDRDVIVVGAVGPLRNRYKMDEFTIRGFAAFLDRNPRAVLLIIGDGPMKQVLADETVRLGIQDKVIMTGHQDRVKEIIAGLDVSLVMGTLDSFSRVVIESLQVGTPLIATDLGGIREVIEDGGNGLLVPYGDVVVFADALGRLALDDDLRGKLADNGRRTVRERLSIESYAASVASVYSEIMGVPTSS